MSVWNSDSDILGQEAMVTPSPGFNRLCVIDVLEIKAEVQEERNRNDLVTGPGSLLVFMFWMWEET